jgi:hypothetical protein
VDPIVRVVQLHPHKLCRTTQPKARHQAYSIAYMRAARYRSVAAACGPGLARRAWGPLRCRHGGTTPRRRGAPRTLPSLCRYVMVQSCLRTVIGGRCQTLSGLVTPPIWAALHAALAPPCGWTGSGRRRQPWMRTMMGTRVKGLPRITCRMYGRCISCRRPDLPGPQTLGVQIPTRAPISITQVGKLPPEQKEAWGTEHS